MNDDDLYGGGMPTGPDIKRLNDVWPTPSVGDTFPYEEIAKIIRANYGTNRFRSVTNAWRMSLQDRGFVTGFDKGKAFFVQSNDQVISGTYDDVNGVQRKLRRRRRKLVSINPEDDTTIARRDHAARLCHHLEQSAKQTKTQIRIPETDHLPKPTPKLVSCD